MRFFPKAVMYATGSVIAVAAIKKDAARAAEWKANGQQTPARYFPNMGIYTPAFKSKDETIVQQPSAPTSEM